MMRCASFATVVASISSSVGMTIPNCFSKPSCSSTSINEIHAQIQQRLVGRQLRRRHPDDTGDMLGQQLLGDRNCLSAREPSKVRPELLETSAGALTRRVVKKLAHQGEFRCFGHARQNREPRPAHFSQRNLRRPGANRLLHPVERARWSEQLYAEPLSKHPGHDSVARQVADIPDRPPGDRQRRQAEPTPIVGQSFQIQIGCDVVCLSLVAEQRCRRRVHDEKIQLPVERLLMQVPCPGDFRSQDVVEVLFRHIDQAGILDHPRAVYDTAQWRHFALHATQQVGNLVRIGNIDGKFVNRGAVLPQARECRGCIGRGGLAAPDDREMAGALPDKPLSRCKAEPAATPGDEITGRG